MSDNDAYQSEQAVLGGCLLSPNRIDDINLRADEFSLSEHQALWIAITDMRQRGDAIDFFTLAQHVNADGQLLAYIGRLAKDCPSAANVERYAEIVRACSKLRRARVIVSEAKDALGSWRDVQSVVDDAQNALNSLDYHEGGLRVLKDFLPDFVADLDARYNTPKIPGLTTGNPDLDRLTGGMRPGELWVVAARPAMGKTVFGINATRINSIEHQVTSAFFSLEMPSAQLVERYASAVGRVYGTAIRDGRLADEDWPRITHAITKMQESRVWIDDTPALSIYELARRARRLSSKGLGLVVVDYLQLMSADARSREQEVAQISKGLKNLAKQLRVPVLALCQLNRDLEKRADKRPLLSDLRESGQIEADADVVIGLYRDEVYNKESLDVGVVEFIVLKQRNGPIDTIRATAELSYSRFGVLEYNPAPQKEQPHVPKVKNIGDYYAD